MCIKLHLIKNLNYLIIIFRQSILIENAIYRSVSNTLAGVKDSESFVFYCYLTQNVTAITIDNGN